jgi:hypothetical protein
VIIRYWLQYEGEDEKMEVSKSEWVLAERAAGFSGPPNEPATAGFNSTISGVRGYILYGWDAWEEAGTDESSDDGRWTQDGSR